MTKPFVTWDRLVRYISRSDGQEKSRGELQVIVYEGKNAIEALSTGERDTVQRLLGPLRIEDVLIVRCIGLNYNTHIAETGRSVSECPTVFTKPSPAIADHEEPIPIPSIAQSQCDYEGELTVLIGRDTKDVGEDDALDFVAAYTRGNDVSARDWQREPGKAGVVPQWSFSKSFDKYAPLGPCLVSARLLGAADNQMLRTYVNGELRQEGNTADLCHGVRKLVAFCSQGQTLQQGSLIMTGTPGGVGLFMKPPRFLQDGDEVLVEISAIGKLRNKMRFL